MDRENSVLPSDPGRVSYARITGDQRRRRIMSGIDDMLALEIDEAVCPWSFTIQDVVRNRGDRKITDDEAMRLMVVTLGTAVMNFEERLNKLEGKPQGFGQA
jgi:hypothetical protein